ncbi:hypothetical protein [Hymenobacter cellulosilyticus]|uniref:DUF4177 domain-containing protein n=1 Tax=Hymenobacter cellulosilyticus TaxID=2932248 RepID=A0A8T9Q8F9_9BACT|nr:hypothetical protein [Hymenobacter cellulosilyticus]UOQ72368.1 hypothetical protein MUN79_28155 [Hymenobacter cellulosilyticus]
MRKITCLLGLLLTTSIAFAQRQSTSSRYLMLVRELEQTVDTNQRASLTVVQPDGTFKTEEIQVEATAYPAKMVNASIARFTPDSTSRASRRLRYGHNKLYQLEVKKLNELSAEGWQLVSTTQEGSTTRYLFRKDAMAAQ